MANYVLGESVMSSIFLGGGMIRRPPAVGFWTPPEVGIIGATYISAVCRRLPLADGYLSARSYASGDMVAAPHSRARSQLFDLVLALVVTALVIGGSIGEARPTVHGTAQRAAAVHANRPGTAYALVVVGGLALIWRSTARSATSRPQR